MLTVLGALLFGPLVIPVAVGSASAHSAPRSWPAAQGWSPGFSQGEPGCGRVALIFNVGSGYEPAVSIFDSLAAAGTPATMFVMGWWAEQNPGLTQQMLAYGFPLGSHGYVPPELTIRSDDDVAWDVAASAEAITWASGSPPGPWFTPYAGAIDDRVRAIVADQGFVPIGWGVHSEDWSPDATADTVYANVMNGVYDGAIVELHLDSSTSTWSTAVALPWIINDLGAQGYRFVTIPEMMEPCW
jgi:peptidoglycan/xylan/chitin deacetylase (PgdA/CDA1 family)